MTIPQFSHAERPSTIAHALAQAGCVVVTDLLSAADHAVVRDELAPHLAKVKVAQDDPTAFYPGLTRRTSALVARSETIGRMVLDDHTIELCDHFLLPNGQFGYQLHVSAALEVGPVRIRRGIGATASSSPIHWGGCGRKRTSTWTCRRRSRSVSPRRCGTSSATRCTRRWGFL